MDRLHLRRPRWLGAMLVLCLAVAVGALFSLEGRWPVWAGTAADRTSAGEPEQTLRALGLPLPDREIQEEPVVVDFGGAPADAPVAGLDQWAARQQGAVQPAGIVSNPVSGTKNIMVLRVYFKDYSNTSRYSKADVEAFFDELDQLWQDTSYGKISIQARVSDLYQLPDNRSEYIDDESTGDLSKGDKFWKVLNDAIANAPSGLDWTDLDAIMVVMAETSTSQFHRGQGTGSCNLPQGPGGSTETVGCAIFSENPSESDRAVWGRWAHEIGHAFQQHGPAHPSAYNSEFELMDSNYPGQTGVYEKQDDKGFPGWMPTTKYIEIDNAQGGEEICLWAMEYDPSGQVNPQVLRVSITGSKYYLFSVRRRILGDDLNAGFTPNGIPDEGVLIEEVVDGRKTSDGKSDMPVVIMGNGNRNTLWKDGDVFSNADLEARIKKLDDDNYCVSVRFNKGANQPDVMIAPWRSAPGNTWETTDIWVDSPVNGYGVYRYGMWSDLRGGTVPRGNGDDPAIGLVNRLYARVRNVGTQDATDVKVTFQITDPPGVGIAGANGWKTLGTVDKNDFPGLAAIPPGGVVDVYIEWIPDFEISDEDLAAGRFAFHTCVRVIIDPVAGETVLGNQDGDMEQENISYFQAVTDGGSSTVYDSFIRLRNDDMVATKVFNLTYKSDLPETWILDINNGQPTVTLNPNEVRDIPVVIKPQGPAVVGSSFGVDIRASYLNLLVNDMDPGDLHPADEELGGARVEAWVLLPVTVKCEARNEGEIVVIGEIGVQDFEKFYDPQAPFQILVQGVDGKRRFIRERGASQVVPVQKDGTFRGVIYAKEPVVEVVCLFAGTTELASGSSGYVKVPNTQSPLPTPTPTRKPQPTWTPIPPPTSTPGPTPTPTRSFLLYPYRPLRPTDLPITVLRGDLSIFGIEITQGIQCFDTSKGLTTCPDNSLPVVTGKLTAARVYLRYNHLFASSATNVPVRLYMSVDNGPWQKVDTSAKALNTLDQSQAENSANFIFTVPGPTTSVVRFYAVVDPDDAIEETNEGNNRYPSSGYITMIFRPREPLKILGRPLDYHPSGYIGTRLAQGWAVNGGAATWFNQLLPIRDNGVDYSLTAAKDWTSSVSTSSGQHDLIQNLNGEYALLVLFNALFGNISNIPDHIYGWVPNAAWTGGHADMPVYPHAGGLGVVGIGTDRPGTSTDNPGGGALIFGHELIHDYDVFHTNTADGCGSTDGNSDFPYSSASIQEYGFNPATMKVYDPADTHDVMSYCPAGGSKEGWIAPFTWQKMFNNLATSAAAAAEAQGAAGDVIAARPGFFTLYRTAHAASILVDLTVQNPEMVGGQKGTLNDLYKVDAGFYLALPDGAYAVELRNGSRVLASYPFKVDFTSEYHQGSARTGDDGPNSPHQEEPIVGDPNPTEQVDITMAVPWMDGTTSIALTYKGKVLDERPISGNPPAVRFLEPVKDQVWTSGTQKLVWEGTDPDKGDVLRYTLLYSYDLGQSWQILAQGLESPSYEVDVEGLPGGSDVRFRVVATDGVNTALAETPVNISIPNKAPQVVIVEPSHGRRIPPDTLVVLRGSAVDLEDGTIPDEDLRWISDRQGELGIGATLPLASLSLGFHTLTLEARDRYGITGSSSVQVFVGHALYLPNVSRSE